LKNSTTTANPYLINFVFELNRHDSRENLIACKDINASGMSRVHPSVLSAVTIDFDYLKGTSSLKRDIKKANFDFGSHPKPYVIAVGVRHHPNDWARDLFCYINPEYLFDLQSGQAIIMFDQSLEGYHTSWLWNWFHDSCRQYDIPPQAVVYVTGDWFAHEHYAQWCASNQIVDRIKPIPYAHFERYVQFIAEKQNLISDWDYNITYKETHNIKTFNCLQKRLRAHRIWFYLKLFQAGLLNKGLVSMNDYQNVHTYLEHRIPDEQLLQEARTVLPLEIYGESNVQFDDRYYIDRIRDNVCLDSWVSVVSEPIFADNETAVFISEKTFKPIACMHPFIILGGKGSLRAVREMGYKTFSEFFDESYDDLPTFERMDAIVKLLKDIDAIKDKHIWFKSMKEVLEHNYKVFHSKKSMRPPASQELSDYSRLYFNHPK
jgi:hypothetical protein